MLKIIKRVVVLFLFLIFCVTPYAQNKIETPQADWRQIIKAAKADTLSVKALHNLVLQTKDSAIAFAYCNRAIELSTSIKNDYLIGRSYSVKAIKQKQIGYIREGLNSLFLSQSFYSKINDKQYVVSTIGNIASFYENLQLYDSAFLQSVKALNIAKENNLQDDISRMNLAIGRVLTRNLKNDTTTLKKAQSYFDEALKGYKKGYNSKKNADAVVGVVSVYNAQAVNKIGNNDFKGAKIYLISALQWCSKLTEEELLVNPVFLPIYENLGIVYQYAGQIDSSIFYYKTSLAISSKLGDKASASNTLNNLGQLYVSKQDIKSAIPLLDSSLVFSQETNSLVVTRRNHLILYQLYDSLKNTTKAIYHAKEYIRFNDTLYGIDRENALNDLTVKYETDKKEVDNKQLKKENTFHKNIIISLAALAIALLAGLVFFIRSRKLQRELLLQKNFQLEREKKLQQEIAKQQQQTLEKENESLQLNKLLDEEENRQLKEITDLQNRQLMGNALSMEQQNNLLQSTYNRLYTIGQKLTDEDKSLVKTLRQDIKGNLQLTNDWEKVTMHFDKVHPQFFEKLKQVKPDLTQNDLKLCAYTKLNLSTKDISSLLSIDTQSVRVNRYRLKKKLQLSEEQDVIQFISSL